MLSVTGRKKNVKNNELFQTDRKSKSVYQIIMSFPCWTQKYILLICFKRYLQGRGGLNQLPNRYISYFLPTWHQQLCSKHNKRVYFWDQHTLDIENMYFVFDFLINRKSSLFLTAFFFILNGLTSSVFYSK